MFHLILAKMLLESKQKFFASDLNFLTQGYNQTHKNASRVRRTHRGLSISQGDVRHIRERLG